MEKLWRLMNLRSKYGRGRDVNGKWIFLTFKRGSTRLLLFPVEKQDTRALIPLIQKYVACWTTTYSDEQWAYSGLSELGYVHKTVNHLKEFVGLTRTHTQNKEQSWKDVKAWVLRSGNNPAMYSKYLARYLFARHYPQTERPHTSLHTVSQLYCHQHSSD